MDRRTLASALAVITAMVVGCGARTEVLSGPPAPECKITADCKGANDLCNPVMCEPIEVTEKDGSKRRSGICVPLEVVDCDDNDPCTNDVCEPSTGDCHYSPSTLDSDGDGFRAALPGKVPGQPGSCGADCDDTSPLAYPGGTEVCDGFDNDCNGVVDDGATFIPLMNNAVRISGDIAPAGPGGLAWSGVSYASIYWGSSQGTSVFASMLDPTGNKLPPGESVLTPTTGDAGGGPIVWIGDRYGLAWVDRRTGDYEVYFALLDENGNKVQGGDKQLTFEPDFSINVSLAWTGIEFIPVWQDRRDGIFNIYAQRIDVSGNPIASNVMLQTDNLGFDSEAPSVAAGLQGIGVAWRLGDASTSFIEFRTFDAELAPMSEVIKLNDGSGGAAEPTVVWNQDRYVISWFQKDGNPKAIFATAVSEQGQILTPFKPISNPGPFSSRYPHLRPLGDRLLVLYADDRDQNSGYELYSRMITSTLDPLGIEQRLTTAPFDSIRPTAAFGPDGNVGVLFRDDRLGEQHVFFTRMGCVTMPTP